MGSKMIKFKLYHSLQSLEKQQKGCHDGTTPANTQTEYIPNTSLECYFHTEPSSLNMGQYHVWPEYGIISCKA